MIKNKHINNFAYENYEKNFSEEAEVEYRRSKLQGVKPKIELIKKRFDRKINVLDVGSGNSKFLYGLCKAGLLDHGYGVEISQSRHDFANKWRDDLNISNVTNISGDIFDINWDTFPKFDLIYCSDIVFQFFDPVKSGRDAIFLEKSFNKLKSKGMILLELDDHENIISRMHKGQCNIWQEFGSEDPWRFVLWDIKHKNPYIDLKRTFIHRHEPKTSESKVILKNYTKDESRNMLRSAGYKNIRIILDDHQEESLYYNEFIITGRKP